MNSPGKKLNRMIYGLRAMRVFMAEQCHSRITVEHSLNFHRVQ